MLLSSLDQAQPTRVVQLCHLIQCSKLLISDIAVSSLDGLCVKKRIALAMRNTINCQSRCMVIFTYCMVIVQFNTAIQILLTISRKILILNCKKLCISNQIVFSFSVFSSFRCQRKCCKPILFLRVGYNDLCSTTAILISIFFLH